jgi:hypothetical protein
MILYIFVDRTGDESLEKLVLSVRESVITFMLCKSDPASHLCVLSTRKSLTWDCRTTWCFCPSTANHLWEVVNANISNPY